MKIYRVCDYSGAHIGLFATLREDNDKVVSDIKESYEIAVKNNYIDSTLDIYSAAESYLEDLSLIHISEPTRLLSTSYAVFCLKKKKNTIPQQTECS